jgi:putative ABC transport system substrate-binding protein
MSADQLDPDPEALADRPPRPVGGERRDAAALGQREAGPVAEREPRLLRCRPEARRGGGIFRREIDHSEVELPEKLARLLDRHALVDQPRLDLAGDHRRNQAIRQQALDRFAAGLADLGYEEGRNLTVVYRYSDGHADSLAALARELAALRPDVLVTAGVLPTEAARRATSSLPIVSVSTDPVGAGFVESLARPGGTITGLAVPYGEGFSGKWLELLREIAPGATRAAYLWNPANRSSAAAWKEMQQAAPAVALRLLSIEVRAPGEHDAAFAAILREGIEALVVDADPVNSLQRERLVAFAAAHRLPAVYPFADYVAAGGLLSYGPSLPELWRRAAVYVDKILKGAKPAELPVEQPTRLYLVINLKTARALGLPLPPALLARADEVIE